MDLTKVYYDSEERPGNILQIIKREPEWAANRIQEGEKAIAELEELIAEYPNKELTRSSG